MSTFTVYKSDKYSFKTLGIVNRILLVSMVLTMVLFQFGFQFKKEFEFTTVETIIYFILVIGLFTIITLIGSRMNKTVKPIGELKTASKNITKILGDYSESYDFENIKEIKIGKLISGWFFSVSGQTTKVKIMLKSNKTETLVISTYSDDNPRITFKESLAKIEKYAGQKINIAK